MSCEEATDWLEICRPDIVIVDIELRDGRSGQVVERLLETAIPFIVHSGGHPGTHSDTVFAKGTWVNKLAAPDELISAAKELLSTT